MCVCVCVLTADLGVEHLGLACMKQRPWTCSWMLTDQVLSGHSPVHSHKKKSKEGFPEGSAGDYYFHPSVEINRESCVHRATGLPRSHYHTLGGEVGSKQILTDSSSKNLHVIIPGLDSTGTGNDPIRPAKAAIPGHPGPGHPMAFGGL